MLESTLLQRDFSAGAFLWILQNFKKASLTEHVKVTAST